MAQREFQWPPIAVQMLLVIAKHATEGKPINYAPASWFQLSPTPRNRSRWSRWSRRLAKAGLIRRLTELNRDRVQRVELTPLGLKWIEESCGPGAISALNCQWDQVIHDFGNNQNGHTYSLH